MTLEERFKRFVEKAKKVHEGENLDFSKVIYKGSKVNITMIDHDLDENGNEYGEFTITPSNLLKGEGHKGKRGKKISEKKKLKTEEIIKRFKEVHKGENLDYSKVVYNGMDVDVIIICNDLQENGEPYGEFKITPRNHLKGCVDKQLSLNKLKNKRLNELEKFIEEIKKDYENNCSIHKIAKKFKTSHIKISELLKKYGYKIEHVSKKISFSEEEINLMIDDYLNTKMTMEDISKKHKIRIKRLSKYFKERNVKIKRKQTSNFTLEDFIKKSREKHGDKYDYSKVKYINTKIPVTIICPIHGEFIQPPYLHYKKGCGCKKCKSSKLENMILMSLIKNKILFDYQYKIENSLKTIDFYLREKDVYIECQGEQHYRPSKFNKEISEEESLKLFEKQIDNDIEKYNFVKKQNKEIIYFTKPSLFMEKDINVFNGFYEDKKVFTSLTELIKFIKKLPSLYNENIIDDIKLFMNSIDENIIYKYDYFQYKNKIIFINENFKKTNRKKQKDIEYYFINKNDFFTKKEETFNKVYKIIKGG